MSQMLGKYLIGENTGYVVKRNLYGWKTDLLVNRCSLVCCHYVFCNECEKEPSMYNKKNTIITLKKYPEKNKKNLNAQKGGFPTSLFH